MDTGGRDELPFRDNTKFFKTRKCDRSILLTPSKLTQIFPCDTCSRKFNSKQGRTIHMKKCKSIQLTTSNNDDIAMSDQQTNTSTVKTDAITLTLKKPTTSTVNLGATTTLDEKVTTSTSAIDTNTLSIENEIIPTSKEENTAVEEVNVQKIENPTINKQPQNTKQCAIKIWGCHTEADLKQIVDATYEEIVHWRKNLFLIPSGSAGK